MKLPKCRTCGHRHSLGAPCKLHDAEIGMLIEGVGRSDTTSTPAQVTTRDLDVLTSPPTVVVATNAAIQAGESALKQAMTAAEKQKAYRERHKDKIREANRLRMAAKRREDG